MALLVAPLVVACQEQPDFPNRPLAAGAANPAPATLGDAGAPTHPIILVAFSGGGARAAALGLGVLDELRAARFSWNGQSERLIDSIKVISSVSGGSVIGAWYALVGPDRVDELRPRFLEQDNMATLEHQAADPITLSRLAFGRYTRIDVQRDLFDRELFQRHTFADLRQNAAAPFLILNATDMASGEVFSFTPQRFDDICSDLGELGLAVGVAASAAFPVALSPMSLRNYRYETCPAAGAPEWIADELGKAGSRFVNLEEYKRARYANALRNGANPPPYRDEHYLHLLDGGLADNQGVRSLSDVLAPNNPLALSRAISLGKAKRIVVISVNARGDVDNHIGPNPAVPGLFAVLNAVFGVPIDATTAYANASLQELVTELQNAGAVSVDAQGKPLFAGMHVYSIPIDFDQFPASAQDLQQRVKNIGTSWNMSGDQITDTLNAGHFLLSQHPCFQRLLVDLGATAPSDEPPLNAAKARFICRFEGDPSG